MKASDMNGKFPLKKNEQFLVLTNKINSFSGLADPYVKGQLGAYRFRTKTQKKTLSPKWQEEFKIPITTWESPNILMIEVRDKDHFIDDILGFVFLLSFSLDI